MVGKVKIQNPGYTIGGTPQTLKRSASEHHRNYD